MPNPPFQVASFTLFFGQCPLTKQWCIFYRKYYNICAFKRGKYAIRNIKRMKRCPIPADKLDKYRLGWARYRKPHYFPRIKGEEHGEDNKTSQT